MGYDLRGMTKPSLCPCWVCISYSEVVDMLDKLEWENAIGVREYEVCLDTHFEETV